MASTPPSPTRVWPLLLGFLPMNQIISRVQEIIMHRGCPKLLERCDSSPYFCILLIHGHNSRSLPLSTILMTFQATQAIPHTLVIPTRRFLGRRRGCQKYAAPSVTLMDPERAGLVDMTLRKCFLTILHRSLTICVSSIKNALMFSGLVFQSLVLANEPHYDVCESYIVLYPGNSLLPFACSSGLSFQMVSRPSSPLPVMT